MGEVRLDKWMCPKCEIWVDPPVEEMCWHCREEKEACTECGGVRYHLSSCVHHPHTQAKAKQERFKAEQARVKARSEFPCIACGGEDAHIEIEGELRCVHASEQEFPCSYCTGMTRHWFPCPKHPHTDTIFEKIEDEKVVKIPGFTGIVH